MDAWIAAQFGTGAIRHAGSELKDHGALRDLHDGGTHTEIRKNGKVICDSRALYGMCSDQKIHISHISECTRLGAVRHVICASPDYLDDPEVTAYVQDLGERLRWRLWKLTHLGRQPPPAGQSAKDLRAR